MGCEALFSLWRKWIRFVVILVYVVLLVIAVPLCIWELEKKGAPDHVQAWFVGGMFVLMALPISFWGILQHVLNYTTPYLQRHIIRVLWMVPVYALNAWFALRFPEAAIYLDTLRECYEAYVIYNFMAYLLSFLYHEYPDIDEQVESKPPISFLFPLCLLPPCSDGRKFIQRCKHGVLQYTIVRPLMTIIAFICEMCDKYGEGDFNFSTAWSYIVIIGNFSQIFAMYCLVLFYKAFRHELKPLKPVPKFLCVKAVVFLSFWQGLFIAVLTKTNVIPSNGAWVFYKDIKQVSTGIQDFLICIEMFLAAIAHYFSFSHKPFVNMAADQQDCCSSFMSMWDVRDVTGDVVEHAKYIGQGIQKNLNRGKRLIMKSDGERTPLLADNSRSPNPAHNFQSANPAVMAEDDSVADFDTANKSTSSMNNYAIFENSTEAQLEGLSRSVSLKAYDSGDDEPGGSAHQPSLRAVDQDKISTSEVVNKDNYTTVTVHHQDTSDQRENITANYDTVFEHLDVHEEDRKSLPDTPPSSGQSQMKEAHLPSEQAHLPSEESRLPPEDQSDSVQASQLQTSVSLSLPDMQSHKQHETTASTQPDLEESIASTHAEVEENAISTQLEQEETPSAHPETYNRIDDPVV